MGDTLFKLRLLLLVRSFNAWHKEVWKKDLDGLYCCNGYFCGCYGATNREVWSYQWSNKTRAQTIITALTWWAIIAFLAVVLALAVAGADCQDNCNVDTGAYVRHQN